MKDAEPGSAGVRCINPHGRDAVEDRRARFRRNGKGPEDQEYPIVYQAHLEGPVTVSRRWEAVRESVEDARIVVSLRNRLSDDETSDEAKAKIQYLMEVTLPALADTSLAEMHLGTARYVLDDTNDDEMVAAFRDELMDCVAAVAQ